MLCSGEFKLPGDVATPVLYIGRLEVAPIAPFDVPLVAESELEGKLRVDVWLLRLP